MLLRSVEKGPCLEVLLMSRHKSGCRECLVKTPLVLEDRGAIFSCHKCLQTNCRSGTRQRGTVS